MVRGKQRETFRRKSLEVGVGRPSGLGRRLSIDGADKLVQPPEAAYGPLDPTGVVLLPAQGKWKFPVKFGTPILIIRHTIYLFWGLTPNLRIYDHSQ